MNTQGRIETNDLAYLRWFDAARAAFTVGRGDLVKQFMPLEGDTSAHHVRKQAINIEQALSAAGEITP